MLRSPRDSLRRRNALLRRALELIPRLRNRTRENPTTALSDLEVLLDTLQDLLGDPPASGASALEQVEDDTSTRLPATCARLRSEEASLRLLIARVRRALQAHPLDRVLAISHLGSLEALLREHLRTLDGLLGEVAPRGRRIGSEASRGGNANRNRLTRWVTGLEARLGSRHPQRRGNAVHRPPA